MKIHKKTDLPARDGKEEFSLTVLTCDKRGITNLGYYNFDTEDWGFFMDDYPEYKDTDFVWIYPPEEQMRKFLIESSNAEDKPAVPSAITKVERRHWKIKDIITSKNGQTRSVTGQVFCLES